MKISNNSIYPIGKYIHILFPICIVAFILLMVVQFQACQDTEGPTMLPEITLLPVFGGITGDTSLTLGSTANVWMSINGGSSNITYLGITMNDGIERSVLDTGFNVPRLDYRFRLSKGVAGSELWTFTVMNRQRLKASVSFHVTRAQTSLWGPIITYEQVMLSAQFNPDPGSFFSLTQAASMPFDLAASRSKDIDMLYYYGPYEGTFSSPAESDAPAFFPGLASWSIKNETRYDTTLLNASDFLASHNDSLLLSSYETVNGKRKAKFTRKGDIIAFRNKDGKTGLIYVKNLFPGASGKIECSIKIQK